jgi:hypothetical protein
MVLSPAKSNELPVRREKARKQGEMIVEAHSNIQFLDSQASGFEERRKRRLVKVTPRDRDSISKISEKIHRS